MNWLNHKLELASYDHFNFDGFFQEFVFEFFRSKVEIIYVQLICDCKRAPFLYCNARPSASDVVFQRICSRIGNSFCRRRWIGHRWRPGPGSLRITSRQEQQQHIERQWYRNALPWWPFTGGMLSASIGHPLVLVRTHTHTHAHTLQLFSSSAAYAIFHRVL